MNEPPFIRLLPGGVPLREASRSEMEFFRQNLNVAGMATEDCAVVLNPYSSLSAKEREAVALNEAARVVMATNASMAPKFCLTIAQKDQFKHYGPTACIKATVAARLLSGDPSALAPTQEQLGFVEELARFMKLRS